jgi:hypothetical protein
MVGKDKMNRLPFFSLFILIGRIKHKKRGRAIQPC